MESPEQALQRLREGNRRFACGHRNDQPLQDPARRAGLTAGQEPFAAILGCSDSRVPVEAVFDQGPGDLFVVRVAGNIAGPTQIGSVEFAVEQLGARLVVVMGHSGCGAVGAAVQTLLVPGTELSPNLEAVLDQIRPATAPLLEAAGRPDPRLVARQAERKNVEWAVQRLTRESPILSDMVDEGSVRILGAMYSLATGEVEFYAD